MRGGTTPNPLIQMSNGSEVKGARRRYVAQVKKLGPPRNSLTKPQLLQWNLFVRELPWLAESDRAVLEMACALRAEFVEKEGDMHNSRLNLLRQVLACLGADPVDRNRIAIMPSDDEDEAKPRKSYFA